MSEINGRLEFRNENPLFYHKLDSVKGHLCQPLCPLKMALTDKTAIWDWGTLLLNWRDCGKKEHKASTLAQIRETETVDS